MPNLDSVLKNKDITLPIKICMVKGIVSPVVMYGYETWTMKKAEWDLDYKELMLLDFWIAAILIGV